MKPKTPAAADVEIGDRIRIRRRLAGLSQATLGAAVGVSYQQIQKYETGANRVGGSRLAAIARELRCRPADLFGDSEDGAELPVSPDVDSLARRIDSLPDPLRVRAIAGLTSTLAAIEAAIAPEREAA
jgi:transcriptional regulator with XRE-family HTH domain